MVTLTRVRTSVTSITSFPYSKVIASDYPKMKLLVITSLIIVVRVSCDGSTKDPILGELTPKCIEILDKSDAAVKRVLLIGDPDHRTPTSYQEMDKHCRYA